VLAYSRCSGESGTERNSCPISLLSLLGSEAERGGGGEERGGEGEGRGGEEGGREGESHVMLSRALCIICTDRWMIQTG
jgi:hypothetical protein